MLETKTFKFRVVKPGDMDVWGYLDEPAQIWGVSLPHHCQDWEIAGDPDGRWSYVSPVRDNRDEVILELKQFITEANEALEYVKSAAV